MDKGRILQIGGLLFLSSATFWFIGCAGAIATKTAEPRLQSSIDSLTHEQALEYYMNGALDEEAEDFYKAAFEYHIAQMYDPASAEIALALGRLYLRLEEPRAALVTLESGFAHHPEDEGLSDALAQTYFQTGLFQRADRMFKKIKSRRELNELELRQYAALLTQLERFEEAIEALTDYRNRFGEDPWVLDRLVRLFILNKNEAAAREALETIVALDPTSDVSFFLLGGFAAETKNWPEAEINFRRALELDSTNIRYWVNLSQTLSIQKKYDELFDLADRGVSSFPDQFEFYDIKADALERLGQEDEAVIALRQSIEVDSTQIDPWLRLANIFHRRSEWEQAAAAYDSALTLDPEHPSILNNYAYMLSEQNVRLDEAMDMVTRALALEPESASFVDTRGWIYYRLGRHQEALEDINSVLKMKEGSAEVYEHLGYILQALGKQKEAVKAWEKSLELDPENEELRRQIP